MDETDSELLRHLAGNARMPVATLAKKLGLARSTVQARLDRLEVTGVIAGYTLRLGESARARKIRATVLMEIEPRATPQVIGRLKAMPEVEEAISTSGRVDLVVTLAAPTTDALDAALDKIGNIPGISDTESLIELSTKIDRRI
jgi:DNA-binding Lrp family transcriptional regulator